MSWRDRLGAASFRGVPFFVDASERSGGRRGVTHEYPFRDTSFHEDLGRAARGFTVEGYVLGEDYQTARDALLEALETAGPGQLQHPYYGALGVAATSFRVRETRDEGGMARFSIDFEETPSAPVQPTATPDAPAQVIVSVTNARTAVGDAFLAAYSPGIHMEAVAESLRSATLAANTALSGVSMEVQEAARLRQQLDSFADSAEALVEEPGDLLKKFIDVFEGFGPTTFQPCLGMYDFDPGPRPAALTSNALQEQRNYDALKTLVQRLAVLRAAEIIVDVEFVTYEEAVAARNAVTELLDEQAELVADDSYPALAQLRADVVQAVPGADADLPRLLTFTPTETIPSLVLAYQIYGDLTLEGDLIARNRIAHPGFIVGGTVLQVLSDD
jgi:prophage DNA circulation protein